MEDDSLALLEPLLEFWQQYSQNNLPKIEEGTLEFIQQMAAKELAADKYRSLVESEKERLRGQPKHWFPWSIQITVTRRK